MTIAVILKKVIHKVRYNFIHLPIERMWRAYVIKKTKDKPILNIPDKI